MNAEIVKKKKIFLNVSLLTILPSLVRCIQLYRAIRIQAINASTQIYIVYIRYKVKYFLDLANIVEDNPKTSFSIATIQSFSGGGSSRCNG